MNNKNNIKEFKFPPDFLWGASTSAYQIEGGLVNDWSEWEKKNAEKLAQRAKNYWQPWQQEMFPEMFDPDNYICGKAMDSYNRFDEDLKCITDLNLKAYRMGIEWSRIEPQEGKFDMEVIERYRDFLKKLKNNNIKVVLTLWHWPLPLWVSKEGGLTSKKIVKYFESYVKLIVHELGDLVDYWITLNEPLMIIGHGYIDGKFPPNKKNDFISSFKVFNNYIKIHRNIYQIIHKKFPQAKVSIAMTTGYFEPAHKWNLIEVIIAKLAHYFRNELFINRINKQLDYIGVNYYHHDRIIWHPPFKENLNKEIDDRGWEFYPEGIYRVLKKYKKYKKPILITENGTADARDKNRERYIREHLKYIHKAIQEGVDVRGYFYWSLIDNFEWAEGYWPKFGLYEVDRKTFNRKARPSVDFYKKVCSENKIY
ncbi:family 1 glycosylhydrolase [bacterium]|nr:family 1 glycosylhydrolase [bacterium]